MYSSSTSVNAVVARSSAVRSAQHGLMAQVASIGAKHGTSAMSGSVRRTTSRGKAIDPERIGVTGHSQGRLHLALDWRREGESRQKPSPSSRVGTTTRWCRSSCATPCRSILVLRSTWPTRASRRCSPWRPASSRRSAWMRPARSAQSPDLPHGRGARHADAGGRQRRVCREAHSGRGACHHSRQGRPRDLHQRMLPGRQGRVPEGCIDAEGVDPRCDPPRGRRRRA